MRFLLVLMLTLPVLVAPASADYSDKPEVIEFVVELEQSDGFSRAELMDVFSRATYQQSIVDAISKPAEKVLTWKEYQDIFLTSARAEAGRQFMMDNHEALIAAEKEFGVPPVIVAAIIGVETMYGRFRGRYRVIDALATLAFDYPPRASFFRSELKHFLLLAREENQSPLDPVGSYAGAMGYGQFIPSSYRHYAVDFDGDGVRDIWNNRTDAIGSVANYLARHGWRRGEPIVTQVYPGDAAVDVFTSELEPDTSLAELAAVGVVAAGVSAVGTVSPLRFEGKDGSEFWLGFPNFYTITRYNHSKLYAMAVFQLSERLRAPLVSQTP
ncbi:MAG: lytic murein transglycosylase B [Pseudomonadota bacterium]